MATVVAWDHEPSNDELLERRLERGWRPIPTSTVDGPVVMGHAATRFGRDGRAEPAL